METLITLGSAPVLICLFYIYIRDKYEKEPWRLLLAGVGWGAVMTSPIVHAEAAVTGLMPILGRLPEAFYLSFAVAAFVEESFKFAVLFFLTWRNDNLNERFDGIVYAVFVSLGFAGVENIMYVLSPSLGGLETAISRAVYSVPGHGFFGVVMGYYFAMAKLERQYARRMLIKAYFIPILIHGAYNFILMSDMPFMMVIFTCFVVLLWINGFKKMKKHVEASPFKDRRKIT